MPDFEYCPECDHLLPEDALSCPHCGKKQHVARPAGRRTFILLLAVVIALVVIGLAVFMLVGVQ